MNMRLEAHSNRLLEDKMLDKFQKPIKINNSLLNLFLLSNLPFLPLFWVFKLNNFFKGIKIFYKKKN